MAANRTTTYSVVVGDAYMSTFTIELCSHCNIIFMETAAVELSWPTWAILGDIMAKLGDPSFQDQAPFNK